VYAIKIEIYLPAKEIKYIFVTGDHFNFNWSM